MFVRPDTKGPEFCGTFQRLREFLLLLWGAHARMRFKERFSKRFHTCLSVSSLALQNEFKDLGSNFQAKVSRTRRVFRIETTENQPIRKKKK